MRNQRYKISIVGASGYTGSELARILINHPEVEIVSITSESHKGKKFSDLHGQFSGIIDFELIGADEVNIQEVDVVFLALPHGVSMEFVKRWIDDGVKIIDLSGDFRLSSPEVYEDWYKKDHTFPKGFEQAVYGMPELYSDLSLDKEMDQESLTSLYKDFYKNKPFVRVRNQAPSIKEVRGSNYADIYPFWDKRTKRAIVIAAIDNLVKGAAGQAVHNMNIMLGLNESIGLLQVPMQP